MLSFSLEVIIFNDSSKNSRLNLEKIDFLMDFTRAEEYFAEGINRQLLSLVGCQSFLGLFHRSENRAQGFMLQQLQLNVNSIRKKQQQADVTDGTYR